MCFWAYPRWPWSSWIEIVFRRRPSGAGYSAVLLVTAPNSYPLQVTLLRRACGVLTFYPLRSRWNILYIFVAIPSV